MQIYPLWNGAIPGKTTEIPSIVHIAPAEAKSDAAVVIYSGGGYAHRAPHEGIGYGEYLADLGINAFVVNYRVSPARFPDELLDARRGIRFVRANAERFGVNPDKIAVMGSSAGGHLAAHAATYIGELSEEAGDEIDSESYIPNAQILCYPVLDYEGHKGSYNNLLGEKAAELCETVTPALLATEKTPVAYMWHTSSDMGVNVCNTYRYAARLKELGIPVEMHVYPVGEHGLGLADRTDPFCGTRPALLRGGRINAAPHVKTWSSLLVEWLRLNGFFAK